MPHDKEHVLADVHQGGAAEVEQAIQAAADAWRDWSRDAVGGPRVDLPARSRAAGRPLARARSSPRRCSASRRRLTRPRSTRPARRSTSCASTRATSHRIYEEQPLSSPGVWNRLEYRPLEGFVLAISPFNFTAIGANLTTSPALTGCAVVWKPASTAMVSAYWTLKLFEEAGLPPGVVNLVYGSGATVGDVALASPDLAGVHFTGSTAVFQGIWKTIGGNIERYRNYPRIVGETGGKDFVVAHPSADVDAVATGAAARRLRVPGTEVLRRLAALRAVQPLAGAAGAPRRGDRDDQGRRRRPTSRTSWAPSSTAARCETQREAIEEARSHPDTEVLVGGGTDDSEGYFVEPTIIETRDPSFRLLRDELFGPVLTAYVYPEGEFDETLELVDSTAPYALTGAVFSEDRAATIRAGEALRYAAGNFYVNDKPTGAVVGQQPFGGARASGTNDKAGSMWNLIRWMSPRTIKETFVPPEDYRYPFLEPDS